MHADQIKEVSDTVDQAITQEDLDALGEAERLALVVGAAYGRALHERDEARAMVERLGDAIVDLDVAARDVLTLDALENPTWAQDERLADNLRAALEAARRAVDSIQTNQTQED